MVNENLMSAETRAKLSGRVEVLDKVKELFLLPQLEMMTAQQISDYYEVDIKAIQSCFYDNRCEISADGVVKYTPKTIAERFLLKGEIVKTQYYTDFKLSDDVTLRVPNVGINLFFKRAILQIGMLLRDSAIAKEVRTQLLNTFEHSAEEQRTHEIRTEKEILANYGWAVLYGSREQIQKSVRELVDYNGRYTKQLEAECDKLKNAVKLLTHQAREWTPRQIVNRLCRCYASACLGGSFQSAYRQLYKELLYKKHISLEKRTGGKCLLDRVRDDEWDDVIETAAALCIANEVNIESVLNEVNAEKV